MANESTVALLNSDDMPKVSAGGYDTNRLEFLTHGIVQLFTLIASTDGPDYAMSALLGCLTTVGPRCLELDDLQQVLRDTADTLPAVYARYDAHSQAAAEQNRAYLESLN